MLQNISAHFTVVFKSNPIKRFASIQTLILHVVSAYNDRKFETIVELLKSMLPIA